MANKVLTRVWEHSQQRGAARCLIAVLADVADEHGIAYPGIPYLAEMINEEEDYTYKLLRKLIAEGELLHKPGGGRGRKTLYGVAVGLSDEQKAKLNTALQSRVYHEKRDRNPALQSRVSKPKTGVNPALQNTVLQNTVLQSEKPCTNGDPSQSGSEASGRAGKRSVKNMIHGDPHGGVGGGSRAIEKSLKATGVYPATIRQILALNLDPDTVIASINVLTAAGWGPGAIADKLRDDPPEQGKPYERPTGRPVQPEPTPRPARRSAVGARNPDREAEYAAKIAEWERQAAERGAS